MEMQNIKRLPVGITSYSVARARNFAWIDKTELVVDLISRSNSVFLTRPRRFGKTFLASIISEIFTLGGDALASTKAAGRWKEKTYPVVWLDFSVIKAYPSEAEFRETFRDQLLVAIQESGMRLGGKAETDPISLWANFLHAQGDKSIVLLIDEYDAPLTAHLDNPKVFDVVESALASFFAVTQRESSKFRFIFTTGIVNLRASILLSGFKDVFDASVSDRFAALLGFTESEIRTAFSDHIRRAAEILALSQDEVVERMMTRYGGYSFDGRGKVQVLSPWSVLLFLSYPMGGFDDYWCQSAGSTLHLVNRLKEAGMLTPTAFAARHYLADEDFFWSGKANEMSGLALLTHAGYFTVKDETHGGMLVGCPNEEIKYHMAQLYSA